MPVIALFSNLKLYRFRWCDITHYPITLLVLMHAFGNKIFSSGMHILHISFAKCQACNVYPAVKVFHSPSMRHIGTDGGGDPKCYSLEEASALSWSEELEDPSSTKPLKPHCPSASSGWESPEILGKPSWLLIDRCQHLWCHINSRLMLQSTAITDCVNGWGHLRPASQCSFLVFEWFSVHSIVTSLPASRTSQVAWWITNH